MERRLQNRYLEIVKAHLHSAQSVAAGPSHLPQPTAAAAATQATWRFLNNPNVTLSALVEPLREAARTTLAQTGAHLVLAVHDWSKLDYRHHTAKHDTVQLTHATDVGYELTTTLLVSAEDGSPLAPLEQHLRTANGLLSTADEQPLEVAPHVDQIQPTMEASRAWGLPAQVVHVVDREADSLGHYREWDEADHLFLVRADDRRVLWNGESWLLSEIVEELEQQGEFHDVRDVQWHGQPARQHVAETGVVLHRPAKKRVDGKQIEVPGRPLPLRLIVSRVYDAQGHVLATWLLLTNVPQALADASQMALWYYWRWNIESYFKLLKSQGQEVEHWQQENGMAIARRLLVASMACVTVWNLERQTTAEAEEFKRVLIRLSGRQMKRSRPVTSPALLSGLYVFLAMRELLTHDDYDLDHLLQLGTQTLAILNPG